MSSRTSSPSKSPSKVTPTKESPAKKVPAKKVAKKEPAAKVEPAAQKEPDEKEEDAKKDAKKQEQEQVEQEPVEQEPVEQEQEEQESNEKVMKTLPAKYNKFIQYTYYLITELNKKNINDEGEVLIDEEIFFKKASVFETEIIHQKDFVESFLNNTKTVAKSMRDYVALKKKQLKIAEKEAQKQAKLLLKQQQKELKKQNKKNNNNNNTHVQNIVQLAQNNNTPQQQQQIEQELEVEPFTYDNTLYYRDENTNKLYHTTNHTHIANYNPNKNTIHFL